MLWIATRNLPSLPLELLGSLSKLLQGMWHFYTLLPSKYLKGTMHWKWERVPALSLQCEWSKQEKNKGRRQECPPFFILLSTCILYCSQLGKYCIPRIIKTKPPILPGESQNIFPLTCRVMLKYLLHKTWPGLVAISLTKDYSQWLVGCCW